MRTKHTLIAMIALSLVVLACGTSNRITPTPVADEAGLNLLVVVEGDVQLRRQGWTDYHPTTFGTALQGGDLLRVGEDARVVVLCSDFKTWTVPTGAPSGLTNGCPPPAEPVLMREGSTIGHTRGGSDPTLPYIISPRTTKLLTSTPLLRWNAAPNATGYTVRVMEGGQIIWETKTTATEFPYPGAPPLQPSKTYLLVVEADTGASSGDEKAVGLGFSLLAKADADRVRASADKLEQVNLTSEAHTFVLAKLYAVAGLNAEAIELLEGLAIGGNEAPNVYRALGELYQQVGLLALAESRYTRALELAKATGDAESTAATQAGLGTVAINLGRNKDARNWLQQAKAGYEALGDTTRSAEIDQQIKQVP
jgi:hypothetical protein